jgi:hypothetical protein
MSVTQKEQKASNILTISVTHKGQQASKKHTDNVSNTEIAASFLLTY